ncbi:MAG: hypothetical protein JWM92_626 [Candidatus Nomurabacteria bacterium]|nr:hypothetical protein [Candidatus Nomurabacteria bacterium]
MNKKVKIFAIIVLVIAVLIGAYSYFGNSAPAASTSSLSTTAGVPLLAGGGGSVTPGLSTGSFSNVLSGINGITLDTSIFSNSGYKALRDNPVVLGTATIGRQNPFAPIGTDSGAAQALLQVETLAPDKILSTSAEFGALITSTTTAPSTVVFQYGLSDAFGSDTTPVAVSKNNTALFTATNLVPNTLYYVEAVAVQGSSTATGTIMSFTTAAAQPKH